MNLLTAIPDRNTVPPPKLATDAPVLQAAHPVIVRLRPAFGVKFHRAIGDTIARLFLTRVLEEPLLRQSRFDRDVSSLAKPDIVFVVLRLGQRAHLLKSRGGGLAGLEAIHAGEFLPGQFVHLAIGRNHLNRLDAIALANFKVHLVVGGCHLEDTGSKLDVDVFIRDDRQVRLAFHRQRPYRVFADQMAIAWILRVHRKGCVAGNRLRPCSGDLQPRFRFLNNLHFEVVKLAVLLLHDDLLI